MKKLINKISREQKTRLLLLLVLFVSGLIVYRNYIFGNELLVFSDVGGDTLEQYTMHYATIVNHLREGNFSLWDFNNGFGTSMFNLNLFDPSLMVLYALGVILGPAHMLFFLVWIQIGRILAAGWVFYWFLSEFSFSRQSKFIFSFAYGLSGYLLVWGQHYQFGMVTVYFPLLLLFCEKFLRKEKKWKLFPVMVFFCGIYSVYFTYMCLAGTGLYLLFRVISLNGLTIRQRMGKFAGGCLLMLLGLGMSFAVFLPMASILLNVTSRVEQKRTLADLLKRCFTLNKQEYYETLLLRPFSTNFQNLQELGDKKYYGFWNYYEDPVLFVSVLAVFLVVQFLLLFWKSNETKRTRRTAYGAALFMLLLMIFPVGGYAFNAFATVTYRYTFLLLPMILLAAAWTWDYLKKGGRASIIGVVLVCIFMYKACRMGYEDSLFAEYRQNAVITAVTGTVMAVVLLLVNRLKVKGEQVLFSLLALAMAANVICEGTVGYEDRMSLKKEDTPAETVVQVTDDYLEKIVEDPSEQQARDFIDKPQAYFRELYSQDIQDILGFLRETDKSFYRVEKDFSSATISMDSLAQGYRGVSTYNSVMNSNVKDFVNTCIPSFYYADRNRYTFWDNAMNNWFAAFTGVRYLISKNSSLDSSKYTLIRQFGSMYLYQNVRESDVARFYDETVSESSLREADKKIRKKFLSNAIVLEDGEDRESAAGLGKSQAKKGSKVVLDAPRKDTLVTGSIQAASDGYVLFMIPYEDGWSLKIDGEDKELQKGDLGFLACKVKEGNHALTLTYHAPLLKEGILLSLAFWIIYLMFTVYTFFVHRKDTII